MSLEVLETPQRNSYLERGCFFGGFTFSTSFITSSNGRGMCGIGFSFVACFGIDSSYVSNVPASSTKGPRIVLIGVSGVRARRLLIPS